MEELEYITQKALIKCDAGGAPGLFTPSYNTKVKINSCLVATAMDKTPMANIPSFVVCSKTQKPCVPATTLWQDTYPVKVKGAPTLIGKSCIQCSIGGKIEFLSSGQVPLTPEEEAEVEGVRNDVQKAHEQEMEGQNKPWWQKAGEFVIDMIPVVGPVVSLVKNVAQGNWGMAALDIGFLVLDVVGIVGTPFTGGASLVATTAAKVAARAAIKGTTKAVAKKVSKEAIEAATDQTGKILSKLTVRSLTRGKLCVFACFPAGTPVAVKDGFKNIEDIRVGDEVWSRNPKTGETALKIVEETTFSETDLIMHLVVGGEVIRTTTNHPFFQDGECKDAGQLEVGEFVDTLEGRQEITFIDYEVGLTKETINDLEGIKAMEEEEIETKRGNLKVFNFEVADWHTYFVGWVMALVHNVCFLTGLARQNIKWAQKILQGIQFNKIMQKRLVEGVHEVVIKGTKKRLDTYLLKEQKIISRKATQLSEIKEKTAKGYIDEILKKYKSSSKVANPKRVGAEKIEGKYILQVPKQKEGIPEYLKAYAEKKDVRIEEIEDITMEILKNW